MENFEQPKKTAGGIAEALKKLRALVGERAATEESGMTPEMLNEQTENQLKVILELTQKSREQERTLLEQNPGISALEQYKLLRGMNHALIREAIDATDVSLESLLSGLLDTEGSTTQSAEEMIAAITPEDLNDEIESAEAMLPAMERYALKFQDMVEGFMEKSKIGATLTSLGLGAKEVISFVMQYITQALEETDSGIFLTLSKSLRTLGVEKRAKDEGIPENVISDATKEWNSAYNQWIKKKTSGENPGPAPDLYEMILAKHEQVGAEAQTARENEAREQERTDLTQLANEQHLLGENVTINIVDSASSAKREGAEWKASLAAADLEKDGDTVKLTASGEQFQKAFDLLKDHANVTRISVGETWEVTKNDTGALEVTADTSLDETKANAITSLTPEGIVKKVRSTPETIRASKTDIPYAQLDADGTLLVNDALLRSENNARTSLMEKAKTITREGAITWEFRENEWKEVTP